MNKHEIQAKYLALHDALGSREDAEDKELFDQQHAQIWADCDTELQAGKAELEAKESLTAEEHQELTELQTMFPPPIPFEPIVFHPTNPIHGLEARVTHIEEFLRQLYHD